jgi:hypothetical protein
MIDGRYIRKNMPYKGLVHVFRRIQGLSASFLFVVLCAFEIFLKFLVRFSKSVRF